MGQIDIRKWKKNYFPNRVLKTASKIVYREPLGGYRRRIEFRLTRYNRDVLSLLISFKASKLLYGSTLNEFNINNEYCKLKNLVNNEFSKYSKIDLDSFTISRLDIYASVPYSFEIKSFIEYLYNNTSEEIVGKTKYMDNKCLRIYNQSESLSLYDNLVKENEMHLIPPEFVGKKILNFELQLKKKHLLKSEKIFGRDIKFSDLPAEENKM